MRGQEFSGVQIVRWTMFRLSQIRAVIQIPSTWSKPGAGNAITRFFNTRRFPPASVPLRRQEIIEFPEGRWPAAKHSTLSLIFKL